MYTKREQDILLRNLRKSVNSLYESEDINDEDKEQKDVELDDEVDEKILNEFLGLGSSVKKPEKALSLDNTDDENADLFIAWCAYFMSQASNNVQKGLTKFFDEYGEVIKKSPMIITKGVLKLMSGTIKGAVFGITTVASVILGSLFMLVRLVKSGVEKSKEALEAFYKNLKAGIETFYKHFQQDVKSFVDKTKDTLTTWLGVVSGALMAVANEVEGAAQYLKDIFTKILNDAKDKKDHAVLLTKTWLQAKSEEVKKYIKNVAGDIRDSVVDAWNSMDKKVRKAYNKIAEKLEDWMNNIKDLIAAASEKIADAAEKTKEFAIDKKDKALVWGIQKSVKGLSKNYTEDQVVALVRKAYNESVLPLANGSFVINEAYFYDKSSVHRRLYENNRR